MDGYQVVADGWRDEEIEKKEGRVDVLIDGWTMSGEQVNKQMNDEEMDRWMSVWLMDDSGNGWMDGWMMDKLVDKFDLLCLRISKVMEQRKQICLWTYRKEFRSLNRSYRKTGFSSFGGRIFLSQRYAKRKQAPHPHQGAGAGKNLDPNWEVGLVTPFFRWKNDMILEKSELNSSIIQIW